MLGPSSFRIEKQGVRCAQEVRVQVPMHYDTGLFDTAIVENVSRSQS